MHDVAHPLISVPVSGGKFDYLQFVLDQNPYDIGSYPAAITLPTTAEVEGPAWGNQRGLGYPYGRSVDALLKAVAAGYTPPGIVIPPGGDVLGSFYNWRFGDENVRISKAMRLVYTYDGTTVGEPDSDPTIPHKFTGHILIGYGGPAWP
jgi:hypothetical protein